jgi:hypothetical protein
MTDRDKRLENIARGISELKTRVRPDDLPDELEDARDVAFLLERAVRGLLPPEQMAAARQVARLLRESQPPIITVPGANVGDGPGDCVS